MARSLVGAAALLLVLPPVAHAHFFRAGYFAAPVAVSAYPVAVPVTVSSYPLAVYAPPRVVFFNPVQVYAAPAPVCAPVFPAAPLPQTEPPPVAVPQYAPPTAAPPSNYAPPPGPPPTPPPAPLPPAPLPPAPLPPPESPSTTLMTSATGATDSSFYDVYPVASRGGPSPGGDRRPVCFWNLSGRDVVLKVAGKSQTMPRGGRARLDLERRFTWQVDDREARSADVADGAAGLEIVIRR